MGMFWFFLGGILVLLGATFLGLVLMGLGIYQLTIGKENE